VSAFPPVSRVAALSSSPPEDEEPLSVDRYQRSERFREDCRFEAALIAIRGAQILRSAKYCRGSGSKDASILMRRIFCLVKIIR